MKHVVIILFLSLGMSTTSNALSCEEFWNLHGKYVKIAADQQAKSRNADNTPGLSCKYASDEGLPVMKEILEGAAIYTSCPGDVGAAANKFVGLISPIVMAYQNDISENCPAQ